MATAPDNDPSLTYRSRMSLRSVIDLPSSVRVVRPLVVRSLLTPYLLGGGRAHAALQSLRHDPADAIHDLLRWRSWRIGSNQAHWSPGICTSGLPALVSTRCP